MNQQRPPYTPWRDGPPRFGVGLRPIPEECWLLPDTEAMSLLERRKILTNRSGCSFEAAYARTAASEAAGLVLGHLAAAGVRAEGVDGRGPALWQLAHHVSDDLVLMVPDEKNWRVGAAV